VQASPPESLADPMWRASEIAAKLEQIQSRDIASAITVSWDGKVDDSGNEVAESYLIKVKDEELVRIDPQTRLPDTTNNLAEDALQITNRLRRLLGNAPPIAEIANKPKPKPVSPAEPAIAYNVQYQVDGWASWYGPGFHGRLSASGEVFNQNALTAAHLHLPFGTRVRVTNLNSGLSVVVRINDRGPYVGNRIIDLSAAAARAIGMIESGVAPVRVEILN
jgi:rare lipoprotein A